MIAYCGIDPGREKFGLAVCDCDRLFFSAIVPVENMPEALRSATSGDFKPLDGWRLEGETPTAAIGIKKFFLGDGTGSESFAKTLAENGASYEIVDERMTTLEARPLYWALHPPKLLWRLVPLSLRVPPRPLDDLAAWAVARRALAR